MERAGCDDGGDALELVFESMIVAVCCDDMNMAFEAGEEHVIVLLTRLASNGESTVTAGALAIA